MNVAVLVLFTKGPNRTTANARAWLNNRANDFPQPTMKRDRPTDNFLRFSIGGRKIEDFRRTRLGGEDRDDINGNVRIIWGFIRKRPRGAGKNNPLEKKAERIYNLALDHIISVVGKDAMFSDDLEEVANKLLGKKDFAGVYPVDKIQFPEGTKFQILNTHRSDQPGEHWFAVVKGKNKLYVYDSFGRSTMEIAPSLLKKTIKIVDSDRDAEQKMEEMNCGQRSAAWLFVWQQFGKDLAMLI